jgi:hypothetical protein
MISEICLWAWNWIVMLVTIYWEFFFFFLFSFLRQGPLCSPDWPWTYNPPAFTSWMLGLLVCVTMPSPFTEFLQHAIHNVFQSALHFTWSVSLNPYRNLWSTYYYVKLASNTVICSRGNLAREILVLILFLAKASSLDTVTADYHAYSFLCSATLSWQYEKINCSSLLNVSTL